MEKCKRICVSMEDQKALTTANVVSQFCLMELPIAVLHEILFRLPINSIMQLKFVCTALYKILSHPDFTLNYSKNSPFSALFLSNYQVVAKSRYPIMDLILIEFSYNNLEFIQTRFKPKLPGWSKSNSSLSLAHTFNGLLCLSLIKPKAEIGYICNPVMGECIKLPEHRIKPREKCCVEYGLGFCRSTNHYKVLRIVCKSGTLPSTGHGEVYTIGVDEKWRALPDPITPSPFLYANLVTINEVFHWLVMGDYADTTSWVTIFDLGEEKFGQMSPPPRLVLDYAKMNVTSINDQLCVVDKSDPFVIVLWKMKEYGVVDSWTKDFVLEVPFPSGLRKLVPVTILQNGDILFAHPFEEYIISYNPIERKFKKVEVPCHGSMLYAPSFLSLNDGT